VSAVISLADALRAAHALGPFDAAARQRILDMLGVTAVDMAPPAPTVGVWQPSSTAEAPRVVPSAAVITTPTALAPKPQPPVTAQAGPRRGRTVITQTRAPSATPTVPDWLATAGRTLPPAILDPAPAPSEPLFAGRTRRAILTAALSTLVHEGDIDVDGVVRTLAAGRPLWRVPRLATRTLRRGAQVFVDAGAGLDPYRSDVDQILDAFDDVLADDRMTVAFFTRCPSKGVSPTPDVTPAAWEPPAPGTPVVVISDFGIGGPILRDRASVGEWIDFARAVRSSGHTLVGLVPYEARRWPPRLTRAMVLLHWSERTTAGEVRRALREAAARR
jgi:hypothetical protein